MVSDADFAALTARVTALESRNAAGWAGFADGLWKKVEPYVTPIIVAACGAAVLYFQNLHGKQLDAVATTAQVAVQASDRNGEALKAVQADVQATGQKAESAATNAAMAVQKAAENHADVTEKLNAVKAAAEKPRPLFPPLPEPKK